METENNASSQELLSSRKARRWIKEWSKNNRKYISHRISFLEDELASVVKQGKDLTVKLQIIEGLRKSYKIKESTFKQKARLKCDLEGVVNSKFFHRVMQYRRKKNAIHGITSNNTWISEPEEIKKVFLSYYKDPFQPKSKVLNLKQKKLVFLGISQVEADSLSGSIS